jgi:hypothetical protein
MSDVFTAHESIKTTLSEYAISQEKRYGNRSQQAAQEFGRKMDQMYPNSAQKCPFTFI